jgi:8-amino-7-oxononanoate synthase
MLATSTLHVFIDLLPIVARPGTVVFVDDGLYPIAHWGVERAAALGAPVVRFGRHDVSAFRRAIANAGRMRPVLVADGFCPACGTPAPLRAYVECIAARDGLAVIDDTQALGIMGRSPGPDAPYGRGGGGSLQLAGIADRRVVVVSSLAKAFGAPLAVIAGSNELVAAFANQSPTRVHCSPPSAAAIAAAAGALEINRREGQALRGRLAARVARLRRGLGSLAASPGLFPVQLVRLSARVDPLTLHQQLWSRGVRTVLSRSDDRSPARIAFVMTARHEDRDIDHALARLADSLPDMPGRTTQPRWGGSGNGKSTAELRALRRAVSVRS